MNSFSRTAKELLKEQLDKLEANEHKQIFEIIKRHTEQYTKTQTGILVSTNVLNDECLNDIQTYVNFCLDQRKRMEEDLKTRKTYEQMIAE
uniref:NET domain-containing protein n=1 Tax=viral metagenome TaxID=1070528 RepID=A0A6C0CIU4_9ZZZZ